MNKSLFLRWRTCFLTGLAVTFPAIVSVAAVMWLFSTISSVTDVLLFFLPHNVTHQNGGTGPVYWYWSTASFLLSIGLISIVGLLARYYIGKQMIEWVDDMLMQVPLLNKFYGAIKQVNEAFTSGRKNSFKTVVMVEFPREGMYSIGFITSEQHNELQQKTREKVVGVFVPTTPNPTSGFLILVPENKIIKLDMSVADGIKYIVSLGSISQEYPPLGGTKIED